MKKKFRAAVFGLATLLANAVFAQSDIITTPMSDDEYTQLQVELTKETTNTSNSCILALLKTKSAPQVLNVVEDGYRQYVSVQVTSQDILNAPASCNINETYYEVLVNAHNQEGAIVYRMRNHVYATTKNGSSEFRIYSPYLSPVDMADLIADIRAQSEVKKIDLGSLKAKSSFQKVTVQAVGGSEQVLASIESRLEERAKECLEYSSDAKEILCDDYSYWIDLKWAYNQYIAYTVIEGIDGSKYDAGFDKIVSVGKSHIQSIKDIRDIFSETSLVKSLKQDWIIRNSNKWTHFSQATSWENFWSFEKTQYYGEVSEFKSYSNRLNKEQVNKVMHCAELAAKDTKTNAGYNCVNSSTTPRIYVFNYRMYTSALETGFAISKMDSSTIYVKIPLMSDSTGSSFLQIALPKKTTDTFKSLQR